MFVEFIALNTLIGLAPTSFAAQFKDYDSIQNKGEVGALVAKKVINGYPDGSFKPQSSIKRGEAAKILYFANISLGSPKAQYEGYTGLVENTTPLYYKYYKYYGATLSEYSDLYSAINAGESKLATEKVEEGIIPKSR